MFLLSKALILSAALLAVANGDHSSDIRVIPVERTPEPSNVEIRISYPHEGEIETDNSLEIQLRLELYPIGFHSDFPRAKEIRDSKKGQSIHILVDDKEYLSINESMSEMAETDEADYDQSIFKKLPYKLSTGEHILRIFPVRSFGESLKGPHAFAATKFYIEKKIESASLDLSKPFLTYNQPQGEFESKKPILLDFFVSNTQLSSDGYKVRLTIDELDKRILTAWKPYYIYGLTKGSHTIKIELLDLENKVVTPLFNDLQKTIIIR